MGQIHVMGTGVATSALVPTDVTHQGSTEVLPGMDTDVHPIRQFKLVITHYTLTGL